MEIVKAGKPTSTEKTCDDCGCVFRYEKKDIKWTKTGTIDRGAGKPNGGIYSNVVYCPTCESRIIIE